MSKEAKRQFSSVEDIPDHYLVRKGSIPREFQPDSLDKYFEPKEVALDHCFEPLEEDPNQYIPPGWKLELEI